MVFEKSKNALVNAIRSYGIPTNELKSKSVGEVYKWIWENYPTYFRSVVEKHVDEFFGEKISKLSGSLDEKLSTYHDNLKGYFDIGINSNHTPYIIISVENCPYKASCDSGSPCIRKLALDYFLRRLNYNEFTVESERDPCMLVIRPMDEIEKKFKEFERLNEVTDFSNILKRYLNSDGDLL